MYRLLLCLCTCGFLLSNLRAQDPDIAILGGELYPHFLSDVQTTLENTDRFNSVSQVDVKFSTPSLNTLLAYDAVLVWAGFVDTTPFFDPVLLGDTLADYVDQGGGVVMMVFSHETNSSLQGRWENQTYWVQQTYWYTFHSTMGFLGTIHEPTHPIMRGVNAFTDGNYSYRNRTLTFSPNAIRVADWDNGYSLVVVDESHNAPRVDLNFYPVSENVDSGFWDLWSDSAELMANSLLWTIYGNAPILSFLDPVPGNPLPIHIGNMTPGNRAIALISGVGAGPTSTPYGIVEVSQPWYKTQPRTANANGVVEFNPILPLGTSGLTLYSQAVEFLAAGGTELSNPVTFQVP